MAVTTIAPGEPRAGTAAPALLLTVAEANAYAGVTAALIPDWTRRAVCASSDPDVLFVSGAAQRDAAALCAGCPVKLECLAEALDGRMEFGVWGGMTERQRRALLKKAPEVISWRALLEEARDQATRAEAS